MGGACGVSDQRRGVEVSSSLQSGERSATPISDTISRGVTVDFGDYPTIVREDGVLEDDFSIEEDNDVNFWTHSPTEELQVLFKDNGGEADACGAKEDARVVYSQIKSGCNVISEEVVGVVCDDEDKDVCCLGSSEHMLDSLVEGHLCDSEYVSEKLADFVREKVISENEDCGRNGNSRIRSNNQNLSSHGVYGNGRDGLQDQLLSEKDACGGERVQVSTNHVFDEMRVDQNGSFSGGSPLFVQTSSNPSVSPTPDDPGMSYGTQHLVVSSSAVVFSSQHNSIETLSPISHNTIKVNGESVNVTKERQPIEEGGGGTVVESTIRNFEGEWERVQVLLSMLNLELKDSLGNSVSVSEAVSKFRGQQDLKGIVYQNLEWSVKYKK